MGFEIYRPIIHRELKSEKDALVILHKDGSVSIPHRVSTEMNISFEKYFMIYIDRDNSCIGIKFLKDIVGEKDSSIRKSAFNGSQVKIQIRNALKTIGVSKINVKESIRPILIDGLIVMNLKHLSEQEKFQDE